MKARLLVCLHDYEQAYMELAERHEDADAEELMADVRENYPHVLLDEPFVEEVQGELMWESPHYILTGETGITETMRVYEKLKS